jgi:hypothetical protein
LVGPSTAVTPAPGARPLANVGSDDEKAMFQRISASLALGAHSAKADTQG